MLGLVRTLRRYTQVFRLLLGKLRQLHADLLEMESSDFLIEFLRQAINVRLVAVLVLPEINLRERLVAETVAHHKRLMARGAAEVHEAAFSEQINRATVRQYVFVILRLYVDFLHAFEVVQAIHLNLVSNAESVAALRRLLDEDGIFAGVSSGAVLHVARRLAAERDDGVVVCVLPDGGWKYLSAGFWNSDDVETSLESTVWW